MVTSACLLLFLFVVKGTFAYPLDSKDTNDTDSFRPVALPLDFGSYDPNADGYIDLEELAKVTGTTLDDARKPFMDADIDDDDQISPSEFDRAPWSLNLPKRDDFVPEDNDDNDDDDGNDQIESDIDEDDEDDGNEDANIFDDADDILVDVKPSSEDDDDKAEDVDKALIETRESDDDEMPEEPLEEEDDESRNLDTDEDEEETNEDQHDDDDDDDDNDGVDPLIDDDLLREETVLSEDEFVENAIDE